MTIHANCSDCSWDAQGGHESEMNEVVEDHEEYHGHTVDVRSENIAV